MKEVKVREEKIKEAVEEIFKDIDVKVIIEKMQKLGGNVERGTEMI